MLVMYSWEDAKPYLSVLTHLFQTLYNQKY